MGSGCCFCARFAGMGLLGFVLAPISGNGRGCRSGRASENRSDLFDHQPTHHSRPLGSERPKGAQPANGLLEDSGWTKVQTDKQAEGLRRLPASGGVGHSG